MTWLWFACCVGRLAKAVERLDGLLLPSLSCTIYLISAGLFERKPENQRLNLFTLETGLLVPVPCNDVLLAVWIIRRCSTRAIISRAWLSRHVTREDGVDGHTYMLGRLMQACIPPCCLSSLLNWRPFATLKRKRFLRLHASSSYIFFDILSPDHHHTYTHSKQ